MSSMWDWLTKRAVHFPAGHNTVTEILADLKLTDIAAVFESKVKNDLTNAVAGVFKAGTTDIAKLEALAHSAIDSALNHVPNAAVASALSAEVSNVFAGVDKTVASDLPAVQNLLLSSVFKLLKIG